MDEAKSQGDRAAKSAAADSDQDAFTLLAPALQYHIVNTLGWRELRPVQQACIKDLLAGHNAVVLAPTAGGKTEAALFPLLSLMLSEDWAAASLLYIAPIKALLNNQEARLESLSQMVGRRAFKWHGDVGASARKRFMRQPADIWAITPESIEALLLSRRLPGRALFSRVRAVVIDEVHAFAGDDRGAHLVALLERISRISGHDIQRVGLSATVGDPEAIAQWLGGSSARRAVVVDPQGPRGQAKLKLDFVGHHANAAQIIDQAFRGQRRLVFVDSRRGVEALGESLRARRANVYLNHSSLALSERRAAERGL